jgi:6-phosphofructokinase 2
MDIITFTINPALDKSSRVDHIKPDSKLRCDPPVFEPGGGGINVSRAIKKLGGETIAYYLAGGPTGDVMKILLDNEKVKQHVVFSGEWTRENFSVTDKGHDHQYRFGMPGPTIPEEEWQNCLKIIEDIEFVPEYLVASGSLPPGVPTDFYARMARVAKQKGIKVVVDTSGEGLIKAAEEGVFMLKPNLREMGQLTGNTSISAEDQEELAQEIISSGKAQILLLSMGARGAMLATDNSIEYTVPPTVHVESTVGAGDSMVAGFVYAHSKGWNLMDVLMYSVAAGTAATITSGSELCRKNDVDRLYNWMKKKNMAKLGS